MKIKSLLLPGCAFALMAGAQAQAPGPADPAAAVPPPVYRSAFPATQADPLAAPGDWRRLNAEVGQFENGHVDIIKWEARNAGAARPVAPAPGAAPPPAMGHKPGQGMHHGHGSHGVQGSPGTGTGNSQGSHDGHTPGSKP